MNKNIIALTGVHKAGKDAVAVLLKELLGGEENVEIKSFAEPIQKAVASLLGVTLEKVRSHPYKDSPSGIVSYAVGENPFSNLKEAQEFQKELSKEGYDLDFKEYEITPRDLVIEIAERLKDAFGDGIWANIAFSKISSDKTTIFTDLRFKSELKELKIRNAKLIKIVLLDKKGRKVKGDEYQMSYLSDNEFDYILYNKGNNLEELKQEVLTMIEKLKL